MFAKNRLSLAALSVCAGLAAVSPFATTSASAQVTFQEHVDTGGREKDFDVWRTRDGGYVSTGFRIGQQTGTQDLLITRYDPMGDLVWQVAWDGGGRDIGYSVQETEEGFVVAGETDSFGPDLGIVVLGLDPGGNFKWTTLVPGRIDADPLHDPFPGVALDQAPNGDIVVVGSIDLRTVLPLLQNPAGGPPFTVGGLPVVNRLDRSGAYLGTAVITDLGLLEQGFEQFHYNFTDVRVVRGDGQPNDLGADYDIIISGTCARIDDPIGNPFDPTRPLGSPIPFAGRYDAFLLRTNEDVVPFFAKSYDFTTDRFNPNFPNSGDWGHGLSVSREDSQGVIVVNGKTDYGSTFGQANVPGVSGIFGSHIFVTDPGGNLVASRRYEMFGQDSNIFNGVPGYAAVEINDDNPNREPVIVQTGDGLLANTVNAFLHEVSTSLSTNFLNAYGGFNRTAGESLTVNRRGYTVAGEFFGFDPDLPPTSLDQYLFKTDDMGKTPCLIERVVAEDFDRMIARDTPVACVYPQLFEPLDDLTYRVDGRLLVLCKDVPMNCNPCPDYDGNGIVNISDLFAFIGDFTSTPPSPCTDVDGNGVINISDLFFFIRCFTTFTP
ncbi:MAG: GC-type dockerin domain-anchored protein [Planctomycetota bacterium]